MSTAYDSLNWTEVIEAHRADKNFSGSVLIVGDRTGNLLIQAEGNMFIHI